MKKLVLFFGIDYLHHRCKPECQEVIGSFIPFHPFTGGPSIPSQSLVVVFLQIAQLRPMAELLFTSFPLQWEALSRARVS